MITRWRKRKKVKVHSGQASISSAPNPLDSTASTIWDDVALPILVVDEDREHRERIHQILVDAGFAVRVAESIAAAAAYVANETVRGVVITIQNADGDGHAFLRTMVARGIGPVVVLTGIDSATLAARVMRDGAADFLITSSGSADAITAVLTRAIDDVRSRELARIQRAQLDALTVLSRLKNDFIARVSHELRTPLTCVLGYAELLQARVYSESQVKEFAGEILREAHNLATLVDDLLAIGEYERVGYTASPSTLNLQQVVETVWMQLLRHGTAELTTSFPDEPRIFADRVYLERIVSIMIDNAIQYSPDHALIEISAIHENNGVRFAVTDQGIGFDQHLASRLFEPLYRTENAFAHSVRGLGLGLAHAKAMVTAHGGWIRALSDGPGRGARFEAWLPDNTSQGNGEIATIDPPAHT